MRIATVLFLLLALLVPASFAVNACSNCFSTYIGITESGGTINATVFMINQSTQLEQNISFFDLEVRKFLNGTEGNPNLTQPNLVKVDVNVTPIKDAELFFYVYNRTGGRENVTGCTPVAASSLASYSYTDNSTGIPQYKSASLPYAICTIPYAYYANSSVSVFIEYRGNQTAKPSEREVLVYDLSAGGLNVIASILQDPSVMDPTKPVCLGSLIMFGLLLASMYFGGKSPLSYLDISVPRIPKPKQISYGQMLAGAGNVRLALPTAMDQKFLDLLINRHAMLDFRRKNLSIAALNEIERSKANSVQKYLAKAEAAKGGDWKKILSMDNRELVRRAEKGEWGTLPHQLLAVMNQRVATAKILEDRATVGGGQHPLISKYWNQQIRKIPMIGTYLSIATGSFHYAFRTGRYMAEALVSKPVRTVLEKSGAYEEIGAKVEKGAKAPIISKYLYDVAAMTDTKKMQVGKLFPLNQYAARFYEDSRDAMYEEVCRNILWHELYEQIKQKLGADKTRQLIASQLSFQNVFRDPEFIKTLHDVHMPDQFISIMRRTNITEEQRAQLMLDAIRHVHPHISNSEFWRSATDMYRDISQIERMDSVSTPAFKKAEALVTVLRAKHHIDEPYDLSNDITGGKFFITTGRNNLFYEENGVKKNFGFFALGMKEFINQISFLSNTNLHGKNLFDESHFTVADAFKLAWLKLSNQVFGPGEWYKNDLYDQVQVYDPVLKKQKSVSFVKDILGISETASGEINSRTREYMETLMSEKGKATMKNAGKSVTPENFLYSYDINAVRDEEHLTNIPWKRRQWYMMGTEQYPEMDYWRANMNFIWGKKDTTADHRISLLYEVRGQKFWANMPRQENAWSLMEGFMDTRLANIMNGTQHDFFGYENKEEFKRFSRVDTQKHFNETWNFYAKVKEGLDGFYQGKTGKRPETDAELFKFLEDKKNHTLTYDDLRNSKMPFVFTHDMSYVPYVKGLPVSDFDRIINGVFVLDDEKGKRMFDFNKLGEYNTKLMKDSDPRYAGLRAELSALDNLKKPPSLDDINRLKGLLEGSGIAASARIQAHALLAQLEELAMHRSTDHREYVQRLQSAIGAAKGIRDLLSSASMNDADKFSLMRALDSVDPNLLPMRALSREEIERIKNVVKASGNVESEVKLAFIYQFSRNTHDWQSLWSSDLDFFRLAPEKEVGAEQRGWLGRFLVRSFGASAAERFYEKARGAAGTFESAVYGAGKVEAQAMANNVAVSELYRERGHDMMVKIKSSMQTGGYLENLDLPEADKKQLLNSYNNYANSFQRFFIGWMDSVTRDPRGSSTQWGRQWYLATMYHRGGAMHPEAGAMGGERTFLSPMGWFFAQTFVRAASANWMFGSPFVRMMRGFQTAMFGYPTIWDKNITPNQEFDLLTPWQNVQYSNMQKWRALVNPAESVFSLQKFRLDRTLARSAQLIPGLNMLSYFFPKQGDVDQWNMTYEGFQGNKPLGDYGWYRKLSNVPGLRGILGQSQAQRSQRTGMDVVEALKQTPEDFLQYKGGGFVHHFTDSANPGVSYVDYTGRGRLAPRMASYLVKDLTGATPSLGKGSMKLTEPENWQKFYAGDEYVRRQSSYSMARRGISAEVKRLQFQEELTGYGWRENPMWAPLSTPTLGYWMGKGATSKTSIAASGIWSLAAGGLAPAVPAAQAVYAGYEWWKNKSKKKQEAAAAGREAAPSFQFVNWVKNWSQKKSAEYRVDQYTCPHCNAVKVRRGGMCPNCRRYM
ncbi:Uncharacterised protein [uncultured archaeon]|nr:Uncharacterised protein [uncultured archaeon]